MLDFINPAQILYTLKERYKKQEIYTWVGAAKSVLIRYVHWHLFLLSLRPRLFEVAFAAPVFCALILHARCFL